MKTSVEICKAAGIKPRIFLLGKIFTTKAEACRYIVGNKNYIMHFISKALQNTEWEY